MTPIETKETKSIQINVPQQIERRDSKCKILAVAILILLAAACVTFFILAAKAIIPITLGIILVAVTLLGTLGVKSIVDYQVHIEKSRSH